MTELVEIARFARSELLAQHVDNPSAAAQLEQVRRILAVGKGAEAGLHTLGGVVSVVVLDGEDQGFARGEFVLDVRGRKLDPVKVRRVALEWLGRDTRRGIVRVREASLLDLVLAQLRWLLVRGRALRTIKSLRRSGLGST